MAQLLSWLAVSGARNSDGSAVASGLAYFYEPGGGTTAATVYSDVDGTAVATQPVTLDAAGRATVYTTQPVRVVIQTAQGADVTDKDQANVTRAEAVQISQAGWTGPYLDDALGSLYASVGGTDGQYKESSGATARTIQAKFSEIWISVKDFGAKGDGLTIDTTAVQAAINRVGFLGGGVVYFPPGTYILDQGLTLSSKNGVSIAGAGPTATTLQFTNTSANGFAWSTCADSSFGHFSIVHTSTSSGAAFLFTDCSRYVVDSITIFNFFAQALKIANSGSGVVRDCSLEAYGSAATDRGILVSGTGTLTVNGGTLSGGTSGLAMEVSAGATVAVAQCGFGGGGGVKVSSASASVTVSDSPALGGFSPPFTLSATPTYFAQRGNAIPANTITVATGNTSGAPDWSKGWIQIINASSGGAGTVTVPAPSPSTAYADTLLTIQFINAAGGAVTWSLNAAYKTSAAIPTTDGHTITVVFKWDTAASKWREISRADTTT